MFENLPEQKKKNYLSCVKIASFRKGCKPTEKGRQSSSGITVFAFEHEDGITFSCRYRASDHAGLHFSDHFKYKFKIRKLKSGQTRFIFYNLIVGGHQGGVKTASPNHMRSKMNRLCMDNERARKNPRTELVSYGIYKAQEKRLGAFLRAFLKKHKMSTKGLSRDPFSLMVQLCYPGTIGFDETTLKLISTGTFLLENPLKPVLKTNGKASKRLLYGAISRFPRGAQTLLRTAKYLRINRSLDEAQDFLKLLVNQPAVDGSREQIYYSVDDGDYFEYSIKKITAKQMKVFDRLSIGSIQQAIGTHHGRSMTNDTFEMIEHLNGNDGFNVSEIQYRTLRELHDALVALTPKGKKKNNFVDYEFDQNKDPMKFCKALAENFSDEDYTVCYPAGTEELRGYASAMHNCAFYYHDRIKKGDYAIFCFKGQRLEFMFGVTFHTKRVLRDDNTWVALQLVKVDQAVAHCNGKIEREIEDRLNLKIEQAVKGSFAFWHRTPPAYEDQIEQYFAPLNQ